MDKHFEAVASSCDPLAKGARSQIVNMSHESGDHGTLGPEVPDLGLLAGPVSARSEFEPRGFRTPTQWKTEVRAARRATASLTY